MAKTSHVEDEAQERALDVSCQRLIVKSMTGRELPSQGRVRGAHCRIL